MGVVREMSIVIARSLPESFSADILVPSMCSNHMSKRKFAKIHRCTVSQKSSQWFLFVFTCDCVHLWSCEETRGVGAESCFHCAFVDVCVCGDGVWERYEFCVDDDDGVGGSP